MTTSKACASTAQYAMYQHDNSNSAADVVTASGFPTPDSNVHDGYSRDFTFLMGMNSGDGRGSATVYAGYRTLSAITQANRDFQRMHAGLGRLILLQRFGDFSARLVRAGQSGSGRFRIPGGS